MLPRTYIRITKEETDMKLIEELPLTELDAKAYAYVQYFAEAFNGSLDRSMCELSISQTHIRNSRVGKMIKICLDLNEANSKYSTSNQKDGREHVHYKGLRNKTPSALNLVSGLGATVQLPNTCSAKLCPKLEKSNCVDTYLSITEALIHKKVERSEVEETKYKDDGFSSLVALKINEARPMSKNAQTNNAEKEKVPVHSKTNQICPLCEQQQLQNK
eukprot:TRINITY_DN9401_c0_g1_i2.p1 TRINITY_DN9401_c0_g1~~TRINITY_DN9401_c0_g1_i2.p1  ORF type:complete len:217 (-),score=14.95 TRINITY_DN9401_c0_g1_i2:125-775(-)